MIHPKRRSWTHTPYTIRPTRELEGEVSHPNAVVRCAFALHAEWCRGKCRQGLHQMHPFLAQVALVDSGHPRGVKYDRPFAWRGQVSILISWLTRLPAHTPYTRTFLLQAQTRSCALHKYKMLEWGAGKSNIPIRLDR